MGTATVQASVAGHPSIRNSDIVPATATGSESVTAPIGNLVTEPVSLQVEAAITAADAALVTMTTVVELVTGHPFVAVTDLDLMRDP